MFLYNHDADVDASLAFKVLVTSISRTRLPARSECGESIRPSTLQAMETVVSPITNFVVAPDN
jgi:hypothetical protein